MHAMPVDVPRDRLGSFEPRLIETYSRRLDGFDEKVVQLLPHGMTLRPMQRVLRELYGIDVSPTRWARPFLPRRCKPASCT